MAGQKKVLIKSIESDSRSYKGEIKPQEHLSYSFQTRQNSRSKAEVPTEEDQGQDFTSFNPIKHGRS